MNARASLAATLTVFLAGTAVALLRDTPATRDEPPAISSCPVPDSCVRLGRDEPVVIGVALHLSGDDTTRGRAALRGIRLAVRRQPEVLGHPVDLEVLDPGDQSRPPLAWVDTRLTAIIGAAGPRSWYPEAASDRQIVMVSPTARHPVLTDPEWHQEFFLRTAPNDILEARSMAAFVTGELGVRRVAVLTDGSSRSQMLGRAFADAVSQVRGGEVAVEADVGGLDVAGVADRLADVGREEPELLYAPIRGPQAWLVGVMSRATRGLGRVALAFTDEVLPRPLGLLLARDGIYVAPRPVVEPAQGLASAPPEATFGYQAAQAIMHAIEETAIEWPEGVHLVPRVALKDVLFSITPRALPGARLDCVPTEDSIGDCSRSISWRIVRLKRDGSRHVWPQAGT